MAGIALILALHLSLVPLFTPSIGIGTHGETQIPDGQ